VPDRHAGDGWLVDRKARAWRERTVRRDARQEICDLGIAVARQGKITDRLRHGDRHKRSQQQWHDAAEHEYRAPAVFRQQRRCNEATNRRADREADEHGHHHGGAPAVRAEFSSECNRVGQGATQPEAGEEAHYEQPIVVRHKRGRQRTDAKGDGTEDDDSLAADPICDRAERQHTDHQAEQARAEHGSERAARKLPVLRQGVRNIAQRLRVVAVNEQHGKAHQEDADLKAADRLLVDEIGNVDRRGSAGCGAFRQSHWRSP
jgi:hypothetical protein